MENEPSDSPLLRGNLLRPLPETNAGESFEDLVRSRATRIERIVSQGHATPAGEWYDQDQDEWVAVVEGEGEIEFDGLAECHCLKPGDWLFIPAHRRHRVVRTAAPTVWLAVWM
jgi:cupin 2 domain-containing protein